MTFNDAFAICNPLIPLLGRNEIKQQPTGEDMIAFRVTVTVQPDRVEVVRIMAQDSCTAATQVVEMLFEEIKPLNFRLKVEAI